MSQYLHLNAVPFSLTGLFMPYPFFSLMKIISLHESGHTIAEIAEETGRQCTTIATINHPPSPQHHHGKMTAPNRGGGRGRDAAEVQNRSSTQTSAEHDAAMTEVASHHPFMPLRDVASAAGVDNIHVSLVSTCLKKDELQMFKACGKVALSQGNKAFRLLFAQETLARYPTVFWKSSVFSDERIFRTARRGRPRVRGKGTRDTRSASLHQGQQRSRQRALLGLDRWSQEWRTSPHGRTPLRDQLCRYAPGCAPANAPGKGNAR